MPQPGGSATLYGVLYQVLTNLDWALNVRMHDALVKQDELLQVRLVLEPAGGGGDFRAELGRHRVIVQCKSRRTRKAWTVNELAEDILPDLYLAVGPPPWDQNETYLFVAEGRISDTWPSAPGVELLEPVVDAVRKRQTVAASEDETTTRHKVGYLLSRFKIEPGIALASLQSRIEDALLPRVDHRDRLQDKIAQLCLWILRQASQGEASFTIEEFLRRNGLDVLSLRDISAIRRTLTPLLGREIQNAGYEREHDVRNAPVWPAGHRVLAFSGESGEGKTWRLARLAAELVTAEEPVVWVTSRGNAEADVQKAADRLWKEACRHDTHLELMGLASRWRAVNPDSPEPWLTVCVDDVQDVHEAVELAELPWNDWGMRLAMTTAPGPAHRLQEKGAALLTVPPFSLSELRMYLESMKRDFASIPPDVLQTLRLPLLARIYRDITAIDPDWTPKNEYSIYERCWGRIRDTRQQHEFPQDAGRLKRLALNLLDSTKPYPWTADELAEVGIDDAAQRRLEAVGWLRRQEPDMVAVSHDRLLNWAVAEALAEQWCTGALSTESFIEKLEICQRPFDHGLKRWLGYVVMDAFWLLADRKRGLARRVAELLSLIENGFLFHSLYSDLLPTLGDRAVPILIERLRQVDTQHNTAPERLLDCLVESLEAADTRARELVVDWIEDSHPHVRAAGIRVLTHFPSALAIERLWRLHVRNTRDYDTRPGLDTYLPYEQTQKAVSAYLRLEPAWLERKAEEALSDPRMAAELARLLSSCEGEAGREIWLRLKGYLFRMVPPKRVKALISCVGSFGDLEELPRLEEWLSSDDPSVRLDALRELAWLNPDRALVSIPNLPSGIFFRASYWLPMLLVTRPETTQALLREIMVGHPSEFWQIAGAYEHLRGDIDVATATTMLNRLADDLAACRAGDGAASREIAEALELVAGRSRLEILRELEARASTPLEENLTFLANSWRQQENDSSAGETLKHARTLLLRIAGSGFSWLTEIGLLDRNPRVRHEFLVWSLYEPTPQILAGLHRIASGTHDAEISERESWFTARILALLGDGEALIDIVLRAGVGDSRNSRKKLPPINDTLLARATEAARSGDRDLRLRALDALALSGREEALDLVPEILAQNPEDTGIEEAILSVIEELAHAGSESTRRLADRLHLSRHPRVAATALLRLGTEEALARLEDYLLENRQRYGSERFWRDVALNCALLRNGQGVAAEIIWEEVQRTHPFHWTQWQIAAIARLDRPEVHELLLAEAFQANDPPRPQPDRAISAIRGLARFDPAAAFQAAERALSTLDPTQVNAPLLLIDLDPARAVPVLMNQAVREDRTWRLWQIGRALRKLAGDEGIAHRLRILLQSQDPMGRARAAHLCGWMPPGYLTEDLLRQAERDPSDLVRFSCRSALRRQRDQEDVRELLGAFSMTTGLRQWSYLDAALEIGDPVLFCWRGDPLCIWPVLETAGQRFIAYAQDRLDERWKEVQKQAQDADPDHHWT